MRRDRARAVLKSPAAALGSHACAVLALGRRASPSTRRGTRLPWPLRAAVFSGSWSASCCPYQHPPLGPCLRDPNASLSSSLLGGVLPLGFRLSACRDLGRWPGRRLRLSAAASSSSPGALVSVLLPLSSSPSQSLPLISSCLFLGFSLPAGALLPALS